MSFQAYLDAVQAQTGKSGDDFVAMAKANGLAAHAELLAWLKGDFGLGHGHANAVIALIRRADQPALSVDQQVDAYFSGGKSTWRCAFDALVEVARAFGSGVAVSPSSSYLSLVRDGRKFAIVQASGERLDVGVKLKGAPVDVRFEAAGNWNAMVTHRVRVNQPNQIDAELIDWLRRAYEQA